MIIKGNKHIDSRGIITYNNSFDASLVKRLYTIENESIHFIRGWQGHKIEQRWFTCIKGSFNICVVKVDNFNNPSQIVESNHYVLTDESMDYLHVEAGHVTAIKSIYPESKLLVLADYSIGEIQDEYRYNLDYFKNINGEPVLI